MAIKRSNPFLPGLVILLLGLWLGGLVTLVLFVSTLFPHDRTLATDVAPFLFHVFERYQLMLALATLAAIAGWCGFGGGRWNVAIMALVVLATALAVIQISYITPNVNASRAIDPATFQRFHKLASLNYQATTLSVLAALLVSLYVVLRDDSDVRTRSI